MTEERQKDPKKDGSAKGKTDKKRIKAEFTALKKALGDGEASGLLVQATEQDVQAILDGVEKRIDDEVNPLWADFAAVEGKAIDAEKKANDVEQTVSSLSQKVSETEKSMGETGQVVAEVSKRLTGVEGSAEALQKEMGEVSSALTLGFQSKGKGKTTMKGKELMRYLADTVHNVHTGLGSIRREISEIKINLQKLDGLREEFNEFKEKVEGNLGLLMGILEDKGIIPKAEGD